MQTVKSMQQYLQTVKKPKVSLVFVNRPFGIFRKINQKKPEPKAINGRDASDPSPPYVAHAHLDMRE